MKQKHYILSLKHSENAEYLYFLINDDDTDSVSVDANKACVIFDKPKEKEGFLPIPVGLLGELDFDTNYFDSGDNVVFNSPDNLDKLGLKQEEGVLMSAQQYYVLSTEHTEKGDDRLYFYTNNYRDGELEKSICRDLEQAWLTTSYEDNIHSIYLEKEAVNALGSNLDDMRGTGVENTEFSLQKLGLEWNGNLLERVKKSQYYVLSGVETEEEDEDFYFVTEDIKNSVLHVCNNLENAWISDVYSDKTATLIYIEREKIDALSYLKGEERRCVNNNRDNRNKLSLEFNDDLLERVEKKKASFCYKLSRKQIRQGAYLVVFLDANGGTTTNLEKARAYPTGILDDREDYFLVSKELVDKLASDSILVNSFSNLDQLDLYYKDGVLYRQDKEPRSYYAVCLRSTNNPNNTFVWFIDKNSQLTKTPGKDPAYVSPLPVGSSVLHFVPKKLVDELLTADNLINSPGNLKELGLHYNEEGLLRVIPEEEVEEKAEAPKETPVSLLGLGFKIWGLYKDVKKVIDQYKPDPPKTSANKINDLADEVHQVNKDKGFWDEERNVGEMLMLVSSELGEAMEAHRKGKFADWESYHKNVSVLGPKKAFEIYIKDRFEDEVIDAVLRLYDMAAGLNIDLDKHIQAKLNYNRSRERFHGKKY